MAAALAGPLAAQETIIFSKPADAAAKAKTDANLAPEPRHEMRGVFSLPPSIFERSPGSTVAPMSGAGPTPSVSPEQQKAWQTVLDKKNKWTLMTPEEILGIPTAEKILGLPEKNGLDKLTWEERFTRRQEKAAAGLLEKKTADAAKRPDALVRNRENIFAPRPFESVFARPDEKNPQSSPAPAAGAAGKGGSPFGALLNSPFVSADKPETRWGNPFNLPAPPPKATPEQLAGMDRFRESLQPSAIFEKAGEPKRAPAAAVTPRDPFMNAAPDFNPRGSSFAPLKNEVSRPRGLTPLPGITYRPPVTPVRSAAQPDLPPWMREDAEKPSKIPVRKF